MISARGWKIDVSSYQALGRNANSVLLRGRAGNGVQLYPIRADAIHALGHLGEFGRDGRDEFIDSRVKGRFAGPAEGNVVRLGGQLFLELLKNTIKRHPLFPFHRPARGLAKLAVDAVVGASLERNEVHAERASQST